jgi:hypothetical protein
MPGDAILHDMRIPSVAPFAFALVLVACAAEDSPEQQVRAVITRAEEAAEARDVSAAMDLVADEYADANGFNRDRLRGFVHGYFLLNPSISLLVRVEDVRFPADELAQARVTVGALRQGLETDLETFDVELVKVGDDWLLRRADRVRNL